MKCSGKSTGQQLHLWKSEIKGEDSELTGHFGIGAALSLSRIHEIEKRVGINEATEKVKHCLATVDETCTLAAHSEAIEIGPNFAGHTHRRRAVDDVGADPIRDVRLEHGRRLFAPLFALNKQVGVEDGGVAIDDDHYKGVSVLERKEKSEGSDLY